MRIMKTKYWILLLGIAIIVNACKKTDYSNTSTSSPVTFYFNGSINNAPVSIQAGVNNYAMATTYTTDVNGVFNYSGEFMNGTSATGPGSLQLFFKDMSKTPPSNSTHIDSVITPGYFSFSNPAGMPSAYSVQFQDYFNQTATGYSWQFGDGQGASTNAPLHTYSRPGVYIIDMYASSTSCSAYDTNDAPVGRQLGNAFQTGFSNGSWSGLTTTFSAVNTGGIAPFKYIWNFGDGTTSSSASPAHNFPAIGVYPVTVWVTDAANYTDKQFIDVSTPGATGCAVGFYAGTQTAIANPYNLNDVGINWYDNAGTLWTSENNHQHMNSMFKVTSVANYKNNAANQPVKIIGASIICELYNTAGDSIPLTGNVVVGVAHF